MPSGYALRFGVTGCGGAGLLPAAVDARDGCDDRSHQSDDCRDASRPERRASGEESDERDDGDDSDGGKPELLYDAAENQEEQPNYEFHVCLISQE